MTMDTDNESLYSEYLSKTIRYKELLNTFLRISEPHITGDILHQLKEKYNKEIASLREKDRIKDLRGLLRILEKRDALRYDRITPLVVIANEYVKDKPLERTINLYAADIREEPLVRINHYKLGEYYPSETELSINGWQEPIIRLMPKTNELMSINDNEVHSLRHNFQNFHAHIYFYYFTGNMKKYTIILLMGLLVIILALIAFITINNVNVVSSGEQSQSSSTGERNGSHTVTIYGSETPLPVVLHGVNITGTSSGIRSSENQEKVFQRVSENLGKHWRDVARFLGVKESEIDTIEQKSYLGTKDKAYEALCIFKSRCEPCNWKLKLQQALEKARRKDLSEMVSTIWFSDS